MKVITFDDIEKLHIEPMTCYNLVSEMIANKKRADLPAKISMHPADGSFCNVMPSIIPESVIGKVGGVKIVNRYPQRTPSLDSKLLLLDMENGDFLALMDANWITAMRTGAVAAHSIYHLAKNNFQTIGLIGLGNTARATLIILENLFPERELFVKLLKYKGQEELFSERFQEYKNIHFLYVNDSAELVKGSDVIVSCVTYFPEDICSDDCFDEGVLVVPVHTRGFSNCDLFFDKVFADDYSHVCHFKNFNEFRSFSEMCDVVNGDVPGRENDRERIIAYNIGISIHDINYAAYIYSRLENESGIMEIDMRSPKDKFWI